VFGFPIVISLIQMFLVYKVFPYESVKLLHETNMREECRHLLSKIYFDPDLVLHYLDGNSKGKSSTLTFKETFVDKKYRKATIIGFIVMICRQACGIHTILLYSSQIFISTGINYRVGSALFGCEALLLALSTAYLLRHFGRRTLLLYGGLC